MSSDTKRDLLIIAGPTGTGKSDFAIELAQKVQGEVISCDSMQIYKGLDIGTAKVMPSETKGITHHMIDVVEPTEEFSVAQYAKLASACISDIINRKNNPIVVGGTGLYIDSFVYSLSFISNRDDAIRAKLEEDFIKYGKDVMYNRLREIDPDDAKKIHPNNTKRLLRALEIYEANGKSKSQYCERVPNTTYKPHIIALTNCRDIIYNRIEARVNKMWNNGLFDEVDCLLKKGLDWDNQCMQAIGYKEFRLYFEGQASLDDVKDAIILNTKRYAKRQITWLKKYKDAMWYNIGNEYNEAMSMALQIVNGYKKECER